MHYARAVAAAALAVLTMLAGCQSPMTDRAARADVEGVHENLARAFSACDEAAFLDAYAEEFTFLTSNTRSIIKTKDGLRAYLAVGCRLKPNPTASVASQTARLLGTEVLVTGQYLFRVPVGDKIADMPQNFTVLFVRQAGTWKIAAHHVSLVP
jgi:hypothetical protein